jgi:hypothetical protein
MFFSPTYPNGLYPSILSPENPLKKHVLVPPASHVQFYRVLKAKGHSVGSPTKDPYFKTTNLQIDCFPDGVVTTR